VLSTGELFTAYKTNRSFSSGARTSYEFTFGLLDLTADPSEMSLEMLGSVDGDWFAPSTSQVMINHRVDHLDELLEQLAEHGIKAVKGPNDEFNGRFAWLMDPEGNKVELWEPRDPAP
jgi:predicted enzyme related to lactoylglutathione lyase